MVRVDNRPSFLASIGTDSEQRAGRIVKTLSISVRFSPYALAPLADDASALMTASALATVATFCIAKWIEAHSGGSASRLIAGVSSIAYGRLGRGVRRENVLDTTTFAFRDAGSLTGPPSQSARRGITLAAASIGDAWLQVANLILTRGTPSSFGGLPLLECDLVTLDVQYPNPDDPIIAQHASQEWLGWMRSNFSDYRRVRELGDARSYASRLFDYMGSGRNQIVAVIETLRRDAHASYATITTLEPLTDVTYIPCVSLLDFWLRSGSLELVVYAHSIDFGKKGFANLVQLAELQRDVARELNAPVGPLVMIVKSATIYQTELTLMREVIASAERASEQTTSAR